MSSEFRSELFRKPRFRCKMFRKKFSEKISEFGIVQNCNEYSENGAYFDGDELGNND